MWTTGGFNGTTEGVPGEATSLGLRKNGFTTQKGSTNGRVMQMSPSEQQPIPPQQLSPASGQQPRPQGTSQQSSVTVCPAKGTGLQLIYARTTRQRKRAVRATVA